MKEVADFLGVSILDPPTASSGSTPNVSENDEAKSKANQVDDPVSSRVRSKLWLNSMRLSEIQPVSVGIRSIGPMSPQNKVSCY